MEENIAPLLRRFEGQVVTLEWQGGIKLRVRVDTFCPAEDNPNEKDSVPVELLEVLSENPPEMMKPQALIDIKNDEALSEIRDLAGIVIWRPDQ